MALRTGSVVSARGHNIVLAKDMSTEIVPRIWLQDEEREEKRRELRQLQNEVVERELFLMNLRSELFQFERRYIRQVGALYAELDALNARIAEFHSQESPINEVDLEATLSELTADYDTARSVAAASPLHPGCTAWTEESSDGQKDDLGAGADRSPSSDLKSAYREVAKLVHPDLAIDENDRIHRERLMRLANEAYQDHDLAALRQILKDYEGCSASEDGGRLASDLRSTIIRITQIRARLSQIARIVATLIESEIGRLKTKAEVAAADGRDLLDEMAANIKNRIDAAQQRFESASLARERG